VAIRWLLQKDFIPSVIIGAKTIQQLDDNMGAGTGWKLTDEQVCLFTSNAGRSVNSFENIVNEHVLRSCF